MNSRHVKTICTIGPTSESREVLEKLVLAGMDIARLNMSHATHEQVARVMNDIRDLNTLHNKNVKILMDLQGPRMRVGVMPDEGLELVEDQVVTFSTNEENKEAIFVNDPHLHEDVNVGQPLYLANGDLSLVITEKNGQEFSARVINGGRLFSRKGVNVPDTKLTTRGLTEKDLKDIKYGVELGVDYIAMSFVQDGSDMSELRKIVNDPRIKLISKIELKQAIVNLDSVIEESDLIMVARGDLGIELPIEDLPLLQKHMIRQAGRNGTPSIVATQMLLSMVNSPRPTRAEVSDVANAVMDGAWCAMLSDETAFGKYPVEALSYLVKIIERVERNEEGSLPQL